MARRAYIPYVPSGSGGGFGVEIVGLPEVEEILRSYRQPQLDERMKAGLQAAGRVLTKSVKSAAPARVVRGVRPGFKSRKDGSRSSHQAGDLYRSIRTRTLRGTPPAVAVGPMSRMRHLAIRPTRPHLIAPYGNTALYIAVGGGYAKVVHHPGNKAHPWVARGLDRGKSRAVDAARKTVFRRHLRDVRAAAILGAAT